MEDLQKKAIDTIRSGGVILYRSEIGWGLGCDPSNPGAIRKLYEISGHEKADSSILLVDVPEKIQPYLEEIPDIAWELMEVSDKPITLLFSNPKNIAPNLIRKDQTIAFLVTADSVTKNLIYRLRKPLVFTAISPNDEILRAVDLTMEVFNLSENYSFIKPSVIKVGKGNLIQIIRK